MRPLRNSRLRWLPAVLALLGVLLQAGVSAQHTLMQIAASAPKSAAEQWALANNIPICHAAVAGDEQQPAPGLPAKHKATYCVICAGALTAATAQEPSQLVRFAPVETVVVYGSSQTRSGHSRSCVGFEARGPPPSRNRIDANSSPRLRRFVPRSIIHNIL